MADGGEPALHAHDLARLALLPLDGRGHKAIAHILSSYGFDIVSRADSEEEKVPLAIDDEREPVLLGMLAERAENNAKRVFFKFRQSEVFPQT